MKLDPQEIKNRGRALIASAGKSASIANRWIFERTKLPNSALVDFIYQKSSGSNSSRPSPPIVKMDAANNLKAIFNLLWDKAISLNLNAGRGESVTYRDITRISDAIRAEGPAILGLPHLPSEIDFGLSRATEILEAAGSRRREETRKFTVAGICAAGIGLVAISIRSIQSQSVISQFFFGSNISPLEVVGIATGVLLSAGSVYLFFHKDSPKERAQLAHHVFMTHVDSWLYCKTAVRHDAN